MKFKSGIYKLQSGNQWIVNSKTEENMVAVLKHFEDQPASIDRTRLAQTLGMSPEGCLNACKVLSEKKRPLIKIRVGKTIYNGKVKKMFYKITPLK